MYILLELFDPENPNIIVNGDGKALFFNDRQEAAAYGREQLHNPIIVRTN